MKKSKRLMRKSRLRLDFFGAPKRIRTPNPLIRSQMLYPIELSKQWVYCKLFLLLCQVKNKLIRQFYGNFPRLEGVDRAVGVFDDQCTGGGESNRFCRLTGIVFHKINGLA